jgi:hypothetical protein
VVHPGLDGLSQDSDCAVKIARRPPHSWTRQLHRAITDAVDNQRTVRKRKTSTKIRLFDHSVFSWYPINLFHGRSNLLTAPDNAGDLSEPHALFRTSMISGSYRTLLKYEPIKIRSIKPEHRWPEVEPSAHIGRTACFLA